MVQNAAGKEDVRGVNPEQWFSHTELKIIGYYIMLQAIIHKPGYM